MILTRAPGATGKGEQVVVNHRVNYFRKKGNVDYVVLRFFFQRRIPNIINFYIGPLQIVYGICMWLFFYWPLQTSLYSNPLIAKKLIELLKREFASGSSTVILFQERTFGLSKIGFPVVFEFIDALSYNYRTRLPFEKSRIRRLILKSESARLLNFLTKEYITSEKKIFVSNVDKDAYNLKNSFVIPNHIEDVHCFSSSEKKYDFVFSGNFNYKPNIDAINWFLKNVWLHLNQNNSKPSLYLVGIGSKTFADEDLNVYASGKVSSVAKHLAMAKVAVSPMVSGSGMQNKILEALSVGLPDIASNMSRKPIELVFGESPYVVGADSLADWKEKVEGSIDFEHLQGPSFIKKRYGNEAITKYYENVFG